MDPGPVVKGWTYVLSCSLFSYLTSIYTGVCSWSFMSDFAETSGADFQNSGGRRTVLGVTECEAGWQRRRAVRRGRSRRTHSLSPGWTVPGSLSSTRAMCSTTSRRGPIPSTTEPATMKSSKCRSLELQMFS